MPVAGCPPLPHAPLDPAAHAAILDRLAAGTVDLGTLRALPAVRPLGPAGALHLLTLMVRPVSFAPFRAMPRSVMPAGFLAAPAIAGSVGTGMVDTLMLGAFLEGDPPRGHHASVCQP
jgi:hypothetical protein